MISTNANSSMPQVRGTPKDRPATTERGESLRREARDQLENYFHWFKGYFAGSPLTGPNAQVIDEALAVIRLWALLGIELEKAENFIVVGPGLTAYKDTHTPDTAESGESYDAEIEAGLSPRGER